MRWPVALVLAYLALGLELGLKKALAIGPANAPGAEPSFVIPFIVFISLWAPQVTALWTALLMGLVIDFSGPRAGADHFVAGPHALGYMAAAYLVLTMRTLMLRKNWFTMIFLSVAGAGLATIVTVTIFTLRHLLGDPGDWSAGRELALRLGSAVYTAVSALAMAFVLFPMQSILKFSDTNRPFASRRYN